MDEENDGCDVCNYGEIVYLIGAEGMPAYRVCDDPVCIAWAEKKIEEMVERRKNC